MWEIRSEEGVEARLKEDMGVGEMGSFTRQG